MKASSRTKALLAVGVAALAVVGASTLGRCGPKAPFDDPSATHPLEPAAPAPEGLIADVFISSPNASWGRLQRGVGGAVGILPASAGGIICAMLGLDPVFANEIDGVSPAYGVIAGNPADPDVVVALKLNDLRKARGVLVDGETARFASRELGSGITELLPKGQDSAAIVAIGIMPNGYLLLAHRSADLTRLAPYATRTLPRRSLPTDAAVVLDIPRAAIGALVRPKLEEAWGTAKHDLLAADERMRRERGGRVPDFGDPQAIVGALDGWVGKRIAIVGDLETMRLAIDFGDDGLTVLSTLTPIAGAGPAATWVSTMAIGDTAQVAAMPVSQAVALSMRDTAEARADQAHGLEQTITAALGPRLAEGDARKLNDVVEDWTKARTDVLTVGIGWDEPQGLVIRAPVRDEGAAQRTVAGALELARVQPFKELFRVRDVTTSFEELAGLGKVSVATISRVTRVPHEPSQARDGHESRPRKGVDAGDAPPKKKDELGLAWIVERGMLTAATSEAPVAVLGGAARPDRKLGDEPSVVRALGFLGATSNSVVVVQPFRFDPRRANLPVAPAVLSLGKRDDKAYIRLDVANGVLREVARWQMGL